MGSIAVSTMVSMAAWKLSKYLGSKIKNKEVHKTFSTLYNATNNYAAGIISKRGFTGVFNLHAEKFISAVSNALPGTVARLTEINLGKLGASTLISSAIGSLF